MGIGIWNTGMTYPTYYTFAILHKFWIYYKEHGTVRNYCDFDFGKTQSSKVGTTYPVLKTIFKLLLEQRVLDACGLNFKRYQRADRQWKVSHPQPLTPARPPSPYPPQREPLLPVSPVFFKHSLGIYSTIKPLEHTSKYFTKVNTGIVKDVQAENV